jgi:hypothetical protein
MRTRCCSLFALLFAFVLLSAPLAAQTVGIAAFQEGSDKTVAPEIFLTPLVSACMDELFFSGFIATSEKPGTLSLLEFKEGSPIDLVKAGEAFIAYEIEILVSVGKSSYSKTQKIPMKAEYRFINVSNAKILVQGAIQGIEDGEDLQQRIDAWCVRASKTIMPACFASLADRSPKVES